MKAIDQFKLGFILFLPVNLMHIYSRESDIVCNEKISYFFTSDEYDLYFLTVTVANRGCFDNFGLNFLLNFFQIWNAPSLTDITLRMYARQIKLT